MEKIPPFQYSFNENDIEFITSKLTEILRNRRFLTMGDYGAELEKSVADYTGAKYAVATQSCTAALEIILRSLNVEDGEVIVPTNTFSATVFAILRAGGAPVFVDCDDDLQPSADQIQQKLNHKTKAVVWVHIGGYISPETTKIKALCEGRGIPFVEDAAHAMGAELDGKKAGTLGTAGCFSFFSTKVMTAGEGGMLVTNDENIYRNALMYRNQGAESEQIIVVQGYNWRMSEVHALMALSQLRRLDEFIAKRTIVAMKYDKVFEQSLNVQVIQRSPRCKKNYYKYSMRVNEDVLKKQSVEVLCEKIKAEFGVTMGGFTYLVPCHKQPVFQKWAVGSFKNADRLSVQHIHPPIFQDMTDVQIERVTSAIEKVVG